MAMSLNRVQLIGNVTRDPEMRQIPGGQNVTTFSVATNYSWTDSSGQKKDKAEFHNIVAWRKLAEICSQYLRKGSKVFVEGRLQTREFEGQDGVKRTRVEIVLDNMIMLDKKSDGTGSPFSAASSREHRSVNNSSESGAAEPVGAEAGEVPIDDLPF